MEIAKTVPQNCTNMLVGPQIACWLYESMCDKMVLQQEIEHGMDPFDLTSLI